jgi:methylmalonyl-CoA mutase
MVGVTKFVDPDPRPASAEPEPVRPAEGGGDACVPLTPMRLAAPFEAKEAGQ